MTPKPIVPCKREDAIEVLENLSGHYLSADLYEAYTKVAISHNRMPANKNRFGRMLTSLGAYRITSDGGPNRNTWHCSVIRLRDEIRKHRALQAEYDRRLAEIEKTAAGWTPSPRTERAKRQLVAGLNEEYRSLIEIPDVPFDSTATEALDGLANERPRPRPKIGPRA